MTSELTITCDGCNEPITEEDQHIRVMVSEVDNGQGIRSAPSVDDYHAKCWTKPIAKGTSFVVDSLMIEP
jgi:hypothetical protein